MHFLWNVASKFLGFVHNWKHKYNPNIARKAEIKDLGVWQEAGNTKSLATELVLQRLPGQGGLESYISNQTAGCFTSQTEQPAFLSFTILHTSLYPFPFCSKQPFHISREGRKTQHIPLIQNLWTKHLSGTHCCWPSFRWCICRADHQSNSRLQLVCCCSDSCFYRNIAYKQTGEKKITLLLSNADRTRKHRKQKHYGFQNWSWLLSSVSPHELESLATGC